MLLLAMTVAAPCPAQSTAPPRERPAVLAQSTDATRIELRTTVARMLHAPSVTVADDALLHQSLMVIEKIRPRDAQGMQLSGRDFDKPEPFRLMIIDDACVLVRLRTGERVVLGHSQCVATDQ